MTCERKRRSLSKTCRHCNATATPTKEEVGNDGVVVDKDKDDDPTQQRMMIAMHRRTILGRLTHLLQIGGDGGKKGVDNDDGVGDDGNNNNDDMLALILCGGVGRNDDDDNKEGCEGAYALEDNLVVVNI